MAQEKILDQTEKINDETDDELANVREYRRRRASDETPDSPEPKAEDEPEFHEVSETAESDAQPHEETYNDAPGFSGAPDDTNPDQELNYVLCSRCGAQMDKDSLFCPKCGQKNEDAENQGMDDKIDQFNAKVAKAAKKKKMIPIIAACVINAIILVIAFSNGTFGSGKDFRKKYASIADESWCTIASDGSYMKIDTNPYDIDDYTNSAAYYKLKAINSDLGFSAAVFEDMGATRALDGRQSAESPKAIVSWRYHPNNGLEATYSWK